MPVINFNYQDLCSLIGEEVPKRTLIERIPMIGSDMHDTDGEEDDMSVEFFPDRPDLYSVEGLARGLRAFLDIEPGMYEYDVEDTDIDVFVDESVESVRPVFRCAAVFDVEIDDTLLKSIMEMQEKLHITIGRKRSKLAIGVHDLDKVTPPFTYKAVGPHDIRFVPLTKDEEWDLAEILEKHEKGVGYRHLLDGFEKYPIITDANGEVLSFPPIINGSLTTVTTSTRNLFIDVTGYDEKAVKGALDIICTSLAERGGSIGTVIMHDGGKEYLSPDFTPSSWKYSASKCASFLGLPLTPEDQVMSLRRMGMDALAEGDDVFVEVPSTRLDIMHEADLFEDVATGYGYENFGKTPKKLSQTTGGLMPITGLSESLRDVMVGMGFMEVTTLTLSNEREEYTISGLPELKPVTVLNPITEDHTCLRSYLTPSLMRIFRRNKHRDLPQRIFEIGDVVVDAKRRKHLCAMVMHSKTSFTEIKSYTEAVLREIGADYTIAASDYPTFIPGRGAEIVVGGRTIGFFGEMAPKVITDFEITHPVIMFEMDISVFAETHTGSIM
ncbi:MAG: phenylalanine--tRNA ligase subunit beta [Candidatus Methanomethylophilaceae archaeon]|nr:phenylalanine--tRNA ligase subunit beta [Candidatus Methanomethylophilaceae archaeon]